MTVYSALTGHFECCITAFCFACFRTGQAVVGACISCIAFFRDDVQKDQRIVEHHAIRSGLHFHVIFVPKDATEN